jgi:hypothetical protein
MSTIEEGGTSGPTQGYNTMLSSTLGKQKSTAMIGQANSITQA